MIIISSNFIFTFSNCCVIVSFLTKLLTLGTLFLTTVSYLVFNIILVFGAEFVAKLVTQGISPFTSYMLALR